MWYNIDCKKQFDMNVNKMSVKESQVIVCGHEKRLERNILCTFFSTLKRTIHAYFRTNYGIFSDLLKIRFYLPQIISINQVLLAVSYHNSTLHIKG